MKASDMVRSALASAGKTQRELAEFMGWSPQNLSGRLKNDTLTFDELTKALSMTGYTVKMVRRRRGAPHAGEQQQPAGSPDGRGCDL